MAEQNNERAETIFDDPSLALKAAKVGDMEGEPTLRPGVYENNLRFVVRTRVPNDRNNGKIDGATSNRAFFSVLRAVEEVADHQGPTKIFMDNKGHRFVDKKRDPNPSIMSCIMIEKTDNGTITLTISAGKNRPLITFPFLDCTYHQFRGADGGPMQIAQASRLYALGWVDELRTLGPIVIANNYKKPAWMTRNQGGGNFNGGGGGNGGQQGGGNNNWQQRPQQQQQSAYGGGSGQQAAPAGGNDFNFDDDVPI